MNLAFEIAMLMGWGGNYVQDTLPYLVEAIKT